MATKTQAEPKAKPKAKAKAKPRTTAAAKPTGKRAAAPKSESKGGTPTRAPAGKIRHIQSPALPSALRADDEAHPFVRDFKAKWLTRLDFTSNANLQSQLQCAFMLLALGRNADAEEIADQLLRNVDVRVLGADGWETVWRALHLAAWLKSARGEDARELLARAQQGPRVSAHRDREWLSDEAASEIKDALEHRRLAYLAEPLGGVLRWLNDPGARDKAGRLMADALTAVRAIMEA